MNEKLLREYMENMPKTRYFLNDQFLSSASDDINNQLVESGVAPEKFSQFLSEAFIKESKQEVYGIEETMLDEHYCKLNFLLDELNACADEKPNDHFPHIKELEGWKRAQVVITKEINRIEDFPGTIDSVRKELQRLSKQSPFKPSEIKDKLMELIVQLETALNPW